MFYLRRTIHIRYCLFGNYEQILPSRPELSMKILSNRARKTRIRLKIEFFFFETSMGTEMQLQMKPMQQISICVRWTFLRHSKQWSEIYQEVTWYKNLFLCQEARRSTFDSWVGGGGRIQENQVHHIKSHDPRFFQNIEF